MRPTGLESVRAIQAALAETIVPELTSAFAQDAAGTIQMLLESIAGEWDTASEDLRKDNDALRELLSLSRDVIAKVESRNENLAQLVTEIESQLREDEDGSVVLTSLKMRNEALRNTLERIVVALEDLTGELGDEAVETVRRRIFAHLREVAIRGWSFWDVSSFRGRMMALRSGDAYDDVRGGRAVE